MTPQVQGRKEMVGNGIVKGVNEMTDVSPLTREFAPRIQIISLLKTGESDAPSII
jgi:hypothetical protein